MGLSSHPCLLAAAAEVQQRGLSLQLLLLARMRVVLVVCGRVRHGRAQLRQQGG